MKRNGIETWKIKSPLDLNYMKRTIASLDVLGGWPHAEVGVKGRKEKTMNRFFICWESFFWVSGFLYLCENVKILSYYYLGHVYISLCMNFISLQRLFLPWLNSYKIMAKKFVTEFHLWHFKNKSEQHMKIYLRVEKMSKIATIILHSQLYVGLFLFNVTPLYNNWANGLLSFNKPKNVTFEHAVYCKLPFDCHTDLKGYIPVFSINWISTLIVASGFCTNDLYLTLLIFQIWGHYKILIYNFEHFPLPKNYNSTKNKFWYDQNERKAIALMLKENIEHHKLITHFIRLLSDSFGISIGFYYLFHQVIGCILLLEVSHLNPEALGKYGPLTLVLFQLLIQISVLFELLNSMSDKLIHSVYMVPFEYMDYKDMKTVCITIVNVQQEFKMKGAGILPIGVQTMAAILKNTASYYIILRTLAEK